MAQLIINITLIFLIYSLISISFWVISRVEGFYDLSIASVVLLAPYVVLYLFSILNLSFVLSVLISIVVVVVYYLIMKVFVYFPFIKYRPSKWKLMIFSISEYMIVQNTIAIIFGDSTKSLAGIETSTKIYGQGIFLTSVQLNTIIVTFVVLMIFVLLYKFSKIGLKIESYSDNQILYEILGGNVLYIMIITVVISAFLSAIAGIFISYNYDFVPTFAFTWILYGVISMIIGGYGGILYILLGSLLLSLIQQVTIYYIGHKWMDFASYFVLLLFLTLRPYGISGIKSKISSI